MDNMVIDLREKQETEVKAGMRNRVDPLIHFIISQTEERNLVQHPTNQMNQKKLKRISYLLKNDYGNR